MKRRIISVAAAAATTIGLSTVGTGVNAAQVPAWTFQPVATHLNAPRGLAFDRQGNLYVAEAGHPGTGSFGVTHTGAVSKFTWAGGALTPAWSTPFTSIFVTEGGGEPDALGPAAVSATGAGCTRHDSDDRWREDEGNRSCRVLAVLSESQRGVKAVAGVWVPQIGHLFSLNAATGAARSVSNVGNQDYAWTAEHVNLFPDDFPDSNPYAVLTIKAGDRDDDEAEHGEHRAGARTFVANAASNTIDEILPGGRSRVISYIPNETAFAMRDATPTCIAQGPDGMLYVGALDLLSNFAAGSGQSNVWQVNPNSRDWRHNAKLWATGFTTINGCTFDRRGNFWASELFYPNPAGPPGDLARVAFRNPSAITHIGGGSLPLPGGIAQGPDGAMYVSIGSADTRPNSGAVFRVAAH